LGIGPHSSCIVYCVVHIAVGIETTPCVCVTDTIRSDIDFFAAHAVEKTSLVSRENVSSTRKGCLKMRLRKVPDRPSINLKPYICPKYTAINYSRHKYFDIRKSIKFYDNTTCELHRKQQFLCDRL